MMRGTVPPAWFWSSGLGLIKSGRRQPAPKVPAPFLIAHQDQTGTLKLQRAEFESSAQESDPAQARREMLCPQKIFLPESGILAHAYCISVQLWFGKKTRGKLPNIHFSSERIA